MELFEYEGKTLLASHGIPVSRGIVLPSLAHVQEAAAAITLPAVLKAQVRSGKRAEAGGIQFVRTRDELVAAASQMLGRVIGGEPVQMLGVEEPVAIAREWYLSLLYDAREPRIRVLLSRAGGSNVESAVSVHQPASILLDTEGPPDRAAIERLLDEAGVEPAHQPELFSIIEQAHQAFVANDMRLLEINPLAQRLDGSWVALDAKVALDPGAKFRHPEWDAYLGAAQTEASEDDAHYYRGSVGSFRQLGGDIAVMLSGGGASLVCMDALINAGGRPANFAEYSGNPPREKVYRLARRVLSQSGLSGLWIAGGFANFTRIDETLGGIADALAEFRPQYPIVIRRAGPEDDAGRVIMERAADEYDLDLKFFGRETSITHSAVVMAARASAWRTSLRQFDIIVT